MSIHSRCDLLLNNYFLSSHVKSRRIFLGVVYTTIKKKRYTEMANRNVSKSAEFVPEDSKTASQKKGSIGVSFQPKLSIFSVTGTENEFDMTGKSTPYLLRILLSPVTCTPAEIQHFLHFVRPPPVHIHSVNCSLLTY